MNLDDFNSIRHFRPDEIPGWEQMEAETIQLLDAMRAKDGEEMGWLFIVTSAYREPKPGQRFSWHHRGKAIDGVMIDRETTRPLPLLKQWAIAERWGGWRGIGLYPFWKRPGLHLDTRPQSLFERHPRWYRNEAGLYRPHHEYLALAGLWSAPGGEAA